MSQKRRLDKLERVAGPSALLESSTPDMRSVARAVSFILQRGIHERTGPAAEAALRIARLLKAAEEKRA